MPSPRLSHVGLCVSDAERAQRFYAPRPMNRPGLPVQQPQG